MIAFPSNKSCPRCKGEMQYIILTSIPPQYKARCLYCGYEEGENAKQPQTNADRIRSMTDEELAEFISDKARTFGEEYEGYMSALDWLKQEVGE